MESTNYAVYSKGLTKRYPGADAIRGIDLMIGHGEIWGLLGPNGSGKSTLLKCIAGLLKPDRGQIHVLGQAPNRTTKGKVAFLPEIDYLYRWMKIGDILQFVSAMYHDWQWDRAEELLKFMNLTHDQAISSLSKGMRARLKLVIAMARDAELVLLDEPLSGLDPSSRGRIIDVILKEFKAEHQTMILSTHEVGETESLFDSVIFLEKGKVKLIDTADTLRQQHNLSINDLFREVYQ